ncbi:MAG: PqqD family protein [Carboxylicivirga sp.]|nr:PqqD family protein [Carboxylicivirga sp.]
MESYFFVKKEGFVEKTIGDETVIVPLVDSVANMEKVFSLNEIGSFIFNCLKTEQSKHQIIELILNEFEIDKLTATQDLEHFLNKAVDIGIVEMRSK